MSDVKFAAVRELAAEKHYGAARAVLETMPDDPKAERWIAKLDEIAPVKPRRRSYLPWIVAILSLVIGGLGIIGGASLATQDERSEGRQTIEAFEEAMLESFSVNMSENSTITVEAISIEPQIFQFGPAPTRTRDPRTPQRLITSVRSPTPSPTG